MITINNSGLGIYIVNFDTTIQVNPGSIKADLAITKDTIQTRIEEAKRQNKTLEKIEAFLVGPAKKLLHDANHVVDNMLNLGSGNTRVDFVVAANSLLLRGRSQYSSTEILHTRVFDHLRQISSFEHRKELYTEFLQRTTPALTQAMMPRGIHLARELEILGEANAFCRANQCETDIAYRARSQSSTTEYPRLYNILTSAAAGTPVFGDLLERAATAQAQPEVMRQITDCLLVSGSAPRRTDIEKRMGQLIALNRG